MGRPSKKEPEEGFVPKRPKRKKRKAKRTRPVGAIYLRAAEEMGLHRDAVLFKLVKEVAIKTNTTLDLTEYIIAYYLWYVKYLLRGSNFPKIRMPYFGMLQPSLKNVRLSLKLIIKNYKYRKIGRIEFVRMFRYHWLIYKICMDRIHGKHPIWIPLRGKKLREYKISLINNPDRKPLYQLARENPEYFEEMRAKVLEDKKKNIFTKLDSMKDLLRKHEDKG